MPRRFFGTSVAVFVLFFGGALIESIRAGRATTAILWLLFGTLFVAADIRLSSRRRTRPRA